MPVSARAKGTHRSAAAGVLVIRPASISKDAAAAPKKRRTDMKGDPPLACLQALEAVCARSLEAASHRATNRWIAAVGCGTFCYASLFVVRVGQVVVDSRRSEGARVGRTEEEIGRDHV